MADGLLDTTKLNRKIWLVKVPNNVAALWRPLCEQAMNPTNLEDDSSTPQLGAVRVEMSQEESATEKFKMTLTTPGPNGGEPQLFKLAQLGAPNGALTLALSCRSQDQPAAAASDGPQTVRVEGTVDACFNAMPSQAADGKIDQSYAAMNKQRTIQASTKTRTIQPYNDTREQNMKRLQDSKQTALDQKRKGEEAKRQREESKRVRSDADVLERELFGLFEHQQYWTMAKLADQTRQPASHLKTVLEKIAVFNKRGPNRDTYQLKKDYALTSSAPEDTKE